MERLTVGLEEYELMHQLAVRTSKEKSTDDSKCYEDESRTIEEIVEASEKFLDKIWFDRHLVLRYRIESGKETVNPEIWKGALQSAQYVIEKYGEEWDMLDT